MATFIEGQDDRLNGLKQPIPCDVHVGNAIFRKGVALESLVHHAQQLRLWLDEALAKAVRLSPQGGDAVHASGIDSIGIHRRKRLELTPAERCTDEAWPELLPLLNSYAMAMHDAASHQSASRADIAQAQAMSALQEIRRAVERVAAPAQGGA